MERFEAFSTSTLRRMVVHSFMSLCTLLPSALVPSWTRKPGRRAKQIRGWSGAVVFDRDLQAPRAVTFDRFLHRTLEFMPPSLGHRTRVHSSDCGWLGLPGEFEPSHPCW